MNNWSKQSVESWAATPPREDAGVEASRSFLLLAIVLVTMAFTMPIDESWRRSTYDQYVDAESSETGARDGNISRQIALGSLGLFGLAAAAWPGGKRLRMDGVLGGLCLAYLGWCALSCLWANDPMISLKRCAALGCEVAAGLGIARRTSVRQFVWIVFACTLSWIGLGILAELSQGTFRPWQQGYRFAGIFHPNEMGINCSVLTMASLYLARNARFKSRLLFAIAGMSFALLYLTGSRTALAAMIVSMAALWLLMAPSPRLAFRWLSTAAATAVVALALGFGLFDFSEDTVAMGRVDSEVSTLTGRIPLWNELLGYVEQRPWTGHGFSGFWTSDRIADVSHSQLWTLSTAHSTYVDLLLSIGLIGATLCLSAMLVACVRSLRLEQRQAKAGYGFIAMIVIYALASGVLESTVGFTWSLSFLGICGVCYVAIWGDPTAHTAFRESPPLTVPSFLHQSEAAV